MLHKSLVCGLCIMEQSISTAHTHTHANPTHFLDRKLRPYTTTKDTAVPCLRSEVKRVLFRRLWVCVCACVSPTLAQTYAGLVVLSQHCKSVKALNVGLKKQRVCRYSGKKCERRILKNHFCLVCLPIVITLTHESSPSICLCVCLSDIHVCLFK